MLYAQRYAVNDRPWAPGAASTGHARRLQGQGYADYRPGYFYFSADAELIAVVSQGGLGSRAKFLPARKSWRLREIANREESKDDDVEQVCWAWKSGNCYR